MKKGTLLFDFDGVVVDTEPQYTIFWNKMGKEYLNIDDFGLKIKGQTLGNIQRDYFSEKSDYFSKIMKALHDLHENMIFQYVKGFESFLKCVSSDFNTAIVTSSNLLKMAKAIEAHPEIDQMFDKIFTEEDSSKSKPDPECYIVGMTYFNSKKEDTVIFEDSLSGLESARKSEAKVVGLATTNSIDTIKDLADLVIEDFEILTVKSIENLLSKE